MAFIPFSSYEGSFNTLLGGKGGGGVFPEQDFCTQ